MGYLAAVTETVEIGAAILNVFSRTPTLLAQTAAASTTCRVDARSWASVRPPAGDRGLARDALQQAARPHQEAIEIIRAALRREVIEYDGKSFHLPLPQGEGTGLGKPLKMLTRPERSVVPLYIAALGPKSVEGAAEYADGWLPFMYSPEGASRVWGDALAAGTAKRSADLAPLEISAGGLVAVGEDVKGFLDFALPMTALYVGGMGARGKNFYNDLACQYGYEAEAKEIQDLYLDGKKRSGGGSALELLERVTWSVPRATSRSGSLPSRSPA